MRSSVASCCIVCNPTIIDGNDIFFWWTASSKQSYNFLTRAILAGDSIPDFTVV
jgi:hypothetical protein